MRASLDLPQCGSGPLRRLGERLRGLARALGRQPRRCEARPGWLDDEGLAGAPVRVSPRGPRPGGEVALRPPPAEDGGRPC
jgi:hypothetical protein